MPNGICKISFSKGCAWRLWLRARIYSCRWFLSSVLSSWPHRLERMAIRWRPLAAHLKRQAMHLWRAASHLERGGSHFKRAVERLERFAKRFRCEASHLYRDG